MRTLPIDLLSKYLLNFLRIDLNSIFLFLKQILFAKTLFLELSLLAMSIVRLSFEKGKLFIAFGRPNDSLFNIDEDIFNRKRITDVLRQKLRLLDYDNYYVSHSFRRDAVIEARNSGVPEAIIMLLDC